jgi:ferric-dicitrate binding protein FerR (iron transport regulator)
MDQQNKINRLIHYLLKGKSKKEEVKEINEWYNSFNNNEKVTVYTKEMESEKTVKDKILNKTLAQIRTEKQRKPVHIYKNYYWRAAASIAFFFIIAAGALILSDVFTTREPEIVLNEKVTKPGEKSRITLFDGTSITLNADSKFKFPNNFNSETREVYLEGEAYFEVAENPSKPFIVHTGNFTITVLGTVFNVKSFPRENSHYVSLINGSVRVINDKQELKSEEIILKPDQQFSYDKITGKNKINSFNLMQVTGWKVGVQIFNDTPLHEVLVQLQREYGVGFRLEDKASGELKITANYERASFWTIVKSLKALTGLEYRTVGDDKKNELKEIIFFRKGKAGDKSQIEAGKEQLAIK